MTKTCVVTGAASGIGAATAALLDAQGWTVHAWDVRAPSSGIAWTEIDVTDAASVAAAWGAIAEGSVDGLVNAAGIWRIEPFETLTLADWHRTFAVNVDGTFLMCSEAVKHMRRTGGGSIVNLSSLAALRAPRIPSAPYAASKGAIISFTRALAAELGRYRIRVNCVAPGAIDTPMLKDVLSAEQIATYSSQSSLGRLGNADEIAALIVYLLSDAASLVHGACIEAPGA